MEDGIVVDGWDDGGGRAVEQELAVTCSYLLVRCRYPGKGILQWALVVIKVLAFTPLCWRCRLPRAR